MTKDTDTQGQNELKDSKQEKAKSTWKEKKEKGYTQTDTNRLTTKNLSSKVKALKVRAA